MSQSPRQGTASRIGRFWLRVVLRFVQFCASLVAFIALRTACRSFQRQAGSSRMVAVVVSSTAANFATVVNFLVFLYAFAFMVFVEWLRLCSRSVHYCEHAMDVTALTLLLVSSFILVFSDIVLNCPSYGGLLHCGNLYLAVITAFISALAFIGILMLDGSTKGEGAGGNDARQRHRNVENGGPYANQDSPRGQSAPGGRSNQGAEAVPVVTAQPA